MLINVPPHKSLPLAVHDHANDVIDYAAVVSMATALSRPVKSQPDNVKLICILKSPVASDGVCSLMSSSCRHVTYG